MDQLRIIAAVAVPASFYWERVEMLMATHGGREEDMADWKDITNAIGAALGDNKTEAGNC